MERSLIVSEIAPITAKGVKGAGRKVSGTSGKGDSEEAPNKGYIGVRLRRYPYGIRFIPRVRLPKTRYDLPLGEYRTCEEAALVRDVAAFYYGKKGAFNFKNDYPKCLPKISSQFSRQEKIDWVSALAKERGRTLCFKVQKSLSPQPFVSNAIVDAPLSVTTATGGVAEVEVNTCSFTERDPDVLSHSGSLVPVLIFRMGLSLINYCT